MTKRFRAVDVQKLIYNEEETGEISSDESLDFCEVQDSSVEESFLETNQSNRESDDNCEQTSQSSNEENEIEISQNVNSNHGISSSSSSMSISSINQGIPSSHSAMSIASLTEKSSALISNDNFYGFKEPIVPPAKSPPKLSINCANFSKKKVNSSKKKTNQNRKQTSSVAKKAEAQQKLKESV